MKKFNFLIYTNNLPQLESCAHTISAKAKIEVQCINPGISFLKACLKVHISKPQNFFAFLFLLLIKNMLINKCIFILTYLFAFCQIYFIKKS